MNRKVRLDRLCKLQYILENHKELFQEVYFDMTFWGATPSTYRSYKNKNLPTSCNTAACALGSAGLYQPFRKAGLRTSVKLFGTVHFRCLTSFEAGAKFFGITLEESRYLFDPFMYSQHEDSCKVRRSQVIIRVKKLIKEYRRELV